MTIKDITEAVTSTEGMCIGTMTIDEFMSGRGSSMYRPGRGALISFFRASLFIPEGIALHRLPSVHAEEWTWEAVANNAACYE